ncbi:hypothetical protein ND861_15740 [Leptospira sp. 2 VSF19]|uniref:Lactonase, 7-bladed beta-propeller domain protein n=1 Tax=Leptospira soteropolitanensis TaxID=2950025 RepID=A0ABT3MLN4_9LEPT|nr:hypothetical protein [Leptospira soteropolitanensis]MCW7527810.1 hypothetical protein [Leptospira soteropolitanensis]
MLYELRLLAKRCWIRKLSWLLYELRLFTKRCWIHKLSRVLYELRLFTKQCWIHKISRVLYELQLLTKRCWTHKVSRVLYELQLLTKRCWTHKVSRLLYELRLLAKRCWIYKSSRVLNAVRIFPILFLHLHCSQLEIEKPNLFQFLFLSASPTSVGVVTSDFASGGRFKTFEPNSFTTFPASIPIHSDAVGRYSNDRVFIVNRLNRDNIQVLNPQFGFTTEQEFSVGQGKNPQDISVWNDKYFISLYNSDELAIYSRSNATKVGGVSFSSLKETFSTSGVPDSSVEASYMIQEGSSLFVLLQRLDRNDASGYLPPNSDSYLVEVDMDLNQIRTVYTLPFRNPSSKIQKLNLFGEPHLVFSCVGRVGFISQIDAGIIAFRLTTRQFHPNRLFAEETAGGDILAFQIKNDELGFAAVLDSKFTKTIQAFRPRTGERLGTLLEIPGNIGISLSGLLLTNEGKLLVGSTDFTRPGIYVYDSNLGNVLLNPVPSSVELTPFDIFQLQNLQ